MISKTKYDPKYYQSNYFGDKFILILNVVKFLMKQICVQNYFR